MAYTKIKLSNNGKKAFKILMDDLKISINEAQKLIDKKRLFCDGIIVNEKNKILKGLVELIVYENNPKGVEIVFENEDFAVLEKESGVLSHPNGRHCLYSLSDEIWHLWGKEACVAHRLDKETSGVILVAKHKKAQIELKSLFEKKLIQKEYLALARGEYSKISNSVIACFPCLHHINHTLLGDPLYGLSKEHIEDILDGRLDLKDRLKLTGAKRLCLHAFALSFTYKGKNFYVHSKKDIKKEFLKATC